MRGHPTHTKLSGPLIPSGHHDSPHFTDMETMAQREAGGTEGYSMEAGPAQGLPMSASKWDEGGERYGSATCGYNVPLGLRMCDLGSFIPLSGPQLLHMQNGQPETGNFPLPPPTYPTLPTQPSNTPKASDLPPPPLAELEMLTCSPSTYCPQDYPGRVKLGIHCSPSSTCRVTHGGGDTMDTFYPDRLQFLPEKVLIF